jgi:hypothetical protein
MRGHFRYLCFKTFPMTPRTPQCEVFWALLSSSKHSRVPKDSKSPTFPSVGLHPTLGQSGVATLNVHQVWKNRLCYINLYMLYIVVGYLRVNKIPTQHRHKYIKVSKKKKKEYGTNFINYTLKINLDKGLDNYIQNLIIVIANYKLNF